MDGQQEAISSPLEYEIFSLAREVALGRDADVVQVTAMSRIFNPC
jgi:hypothetical protein